MIRECLRCGKENSEATGAATEACPHCGVVYSKAAIAAAQRRAAGEIRDRIQASRTKVPSLVERVFWFIALLGGAFGTIQLAITFAQAESAPQQGAGAAMAAALAVIPYCLARAVQMSTRKE